MTERRPRLEVTDPAMLKALAHPLRMRLYELLAIQGPANASALADHVGEPVALVSYHLHQLGRYGYADPAPELARDRRERWWRAAAIGVTYSSADFMDDPGGRAAMMAAWRVNLGRRVERAQAFHEAPDAWGKDWVDAGLSSDRTIRVTPEELRELSAEVGALLQRWQDREPPDHDDLGTPREYVFVVFDAVPYHP
jgi:DNA-binding transcriptional ArsR family regulator